MKWFGATDVAQWSLRLICMRVFLVLNPENPALAALTFGGTELDTTTKTLLRTILIPAYCRVR